MNIKMAAIWLGRALILLVMFSLASGTGFGKTNSSNKEKLPKFYGDWLNRDVVYIITRDEKKTFLQLTSDGERDKFIDQFWEVRNPNPGSPINPYKDEIYERIAYADAHFGIGSGEEGWRTDRGRTYITLGPPQQIEKHLGAPNLRPMEIWFYSNLSPSLPPFFNVVFFQPDNIGDFRYYSPATDGPDKLVTGMEAINDPKAALHLIQSSVGSEVAHVAQSLIPGEPLDPDGRISLQSDVMLSILKNLANQPFNIDELNRRREMAGTVTSRAIFDTKNLDMVLFPVRDVYGLSRLDYAIRLVNPSDLTMREDQDGEYSYAVEVRVMVSTADKKLIFTQRKTVSGKLSHKEMEDVRHRPFGYEGVLPLPPGKYHLDFLVSDLNQKVGYHAERDVTMAGDSLGTFAISGILPFSAAEPLDPSKATITPFGIAGMRFRPLETGSLTLNQSENLQFAYQIWAPSQRPQTDAGRELTVQYAIGKPAVTGTATVLKDTVDTTSFSSSGSLLNGKKIPLTDKAEGNYILTVAVTGSGASEKAHSSLPFQIMNDVPVASPWDHDEPEIDKDEAKGIFEQERALCYWAQANVADARRWFRLALSKDHSDDIARARLVQAYYTLNAYSAVVSLVDDAGITDNTDSGTIVQIAESFLKTGNTAKAVSLLEETIHSRPDDGPLYLALADSYQQMGKAAQAQEMSRKGRSLLNSSPAPTTGQNK
jgi:GWxTD domain-containing protein